MLVLSRRTNETIRFPQLGISVSILSFKGNRVQVGVDAPPQIQIVRKELETDTESDALARGEASDLSIVKSYFSAMSPKEKHAFKNRLNRALLALQLSQRQLSAGHLELAEVTLSYALDRLLELEDAFCSGKEVETSSTFASANTRPVGYVDGPTPAPSNRKNAEPIEVLLVEDDLNEQALMRTILEMEGYRVHTANNGNEALKYLGRNRPNCVLLDMLMPDCGGAETIEQIRANSRFSELPVFAVSGTSPESVGVSIGTNGVDDWFPKPLNAMQLVQHFRRTFAESPLG